MKKSVYYNPRPALVIEQLDSEKLGRCYYETKFKITSKEPLSFDKIKSLREAGVIGRGQGYVVAFQDACGNIKYLSKENWHNENSGTDYINCVDLEDDNEIKCISINPYSEKPYEPKEFPFFVYLVTDHLDSGD